MPLNDFRNNLKIKTISSRSELNNAFKFLSSSNMLSDKLMFEFRNHLIKFNKNIDYGFTLLNGKNEICGIMLTFEQGQYKFRKKVINIINLSTWYMHPKYRGLPSIWFHSELIKLLDNNIITTYSANEVASKILRTLRFEYMDIQPKKDNLFSNLNFLNIFRFKISEINLNLLSNFLEERKDFKISKDLKLIKIDSHNSEPFYFLAKSYFRYKKIIFLRLPINTISIVWVSDLEKCEHYISKINLILLLKMGVLTTFYYPKTSSLNTKLGKCLIKSTINLKYLEPIGSEISLGI